MGTTHPGLLAQKRVRFRGTLGRDHAQKRVRRRTSKARRNRYAFTCQYALPIRGNSYLFLRLSAQKRVRPSPRRPRSIGLSQKRVRFVGEVVSCAAWTIGLARRCAHARRFGHHAHPAHRAGTWPARFPSFDSHERHFVRAALGRRNLAKSSLAPWWACIGGARRRTASASHDTSQQEETT